ncbi:MAG: glycosyltransferase family 39 protein [Myxococcota bacterium]|nr:glycosyltransferase family 39 protein [Myxococcota bacterium]
MIEPSRRGAVASLVALGGALAFWSFGKWTDPVIDFGYELYVPWRLSEGDVLYREIAYRNGPLSSYWNALLFSIFGVSIRTLVVANLAILCATTGLLFALLERITTRYAALLGTALFLTVCAFSQYGNVGNYNFVTPYQHGQTHGVFLGLLVLTGLERGLRTRNRLPWVAAGTALGALFLVKAEVFVPALATSAVAVYLARPDERRAALTMLASSAVVLPVLGFVALASAMPFADALHSTAGNWPYLASAIFGDGFYANNAGLDDPLRNGLRMIAACAGVLALGCAAHFADRAAPRLGNSALALGAGLGLALAAVLDLPWEATGHVLPIAMLVAIIWFGRRATRNDDARAQLTLLFSIYALVMLGKLGLRSQVQHYGFALAAPALALGATLALGACRTTAASAILTAALVAVGARAWLDSDRIYADKTFELAGGLHAGDSILVASPETSPRGAAVERALRQLEPLLEGDRTLLVLPEGAGLNYWLRRRNPVPFGLFLPTELAAHGGSLRMLDRMTATPPDLIALVHRGHAGFGTGPFLQDIANGAAIGAWLHRDYHPVSKIGAEPFRGPRFGIVLLERNSGTSGR